MQNKTHCQEAAGKAEGCKGCPSAKECSSQKEDPDIEVIRKNLVSFKMKLAIISGKGGVGKSTFSRNISQYISEYKKTLLLDLDFSGPSCPRLTGTDEYSVIESNGRINPIPVLPLLDEREETGGKRRREEESTLPHSFLTTLPYSSLTTLPHSSLTTLSVGHFLDSSDDGLVFNSSFKNNLLKKILKMGNFSEEVLVLDTPPNVTEEHLGMVKYIKPDSCIIITTPQKMAFQDAIRQMDFCKKAGIKVLGVVENMKGFTCGGCKKRREIFTSGIVEEWCKNNKVEYLGYLDLDINIAKNSDSGGVSKDGIYERIVRELLKVGGE